MKSLQGHLLIAPRNMCDPNFAQTVVLVVQHSDEGSLGLILNRPLTTPVREALSAADESLCNVEACLNQGGPCEGVLMVLHTHESAGEIEVLPGVFFSAEQEKVQWLLANNSGPAKFFAGYAGWSPGQLENELDAGGWLVLSAEAKQVFSDVETHDQWLLLLRAINNGQTHLAAAY